MPHRRARLLLVTLVIADAAWLYAACGILGFFAGQQQSPLPWAAVLALVGVGALAGARLGVIPMSRRHALVAQATLGAAAAYAATSFGRVVGRIADHGGFDPRWPAAVLGGELAPPAVIGLVVAVLSSAYLWRHGVALSATATPHRRLLSSFRIGIVVFALALLVEQASHRDLQVGTMLLPFFAASLAGLAASRVPEGMTLGSAWIRAASSCIVVVVGLGLTLGATASLFGKSGVDVALTAWDLLSGAFGWLVRTLLGTLVDGITRLLLWLQDARIIEGARGGAGLSGEESPGLRDLQPGVPFGDVLADILQVAFLCLMLYALMRMLAFAYRQIPHHGDAPLPEEHEFIGEKAEPLADLATLLRRILRGRGARDVPAPAFTRAGLEPGIGEIFELYFELVSQAVLRGHEFVAARTPSERVPTLTSALPDAPVADITRRFNAACYGNEPTRVDTVAALRRALEAATRRRERRESESAGDPDGSA